MKNDEYKALGARLHTIDDVKRIAKEEGYHEDMLLVIYTHRITRNATRNFYKVKAKTSRLLQEWEQGTTLFELARRYDFPPVLMAYLVLMEKGIGRKQFWKYVRNPSCINNKRINRDLQEVVEKDYIYSPTGTDLQVKRGKDGEATMAIILDQYKIQYLVEKELRGISTKTPDFLLHKPLIVDGMVINWIESKANFGDLVEVRRNYTKQLSAYVKLFGPGMVVYWFGYVDDAPQCPDIMMVDGAFIEELFLEHNWNKRVKLVEGAESPTKRFRKKGAAESGPVSLEDFETGVTKGTVTELPEPEHDEKPAEETVHAYIHSQEDAEPQTHWHAQEEKHSHEHPAPQHPPQQQQQSQGQQRQGVGRDRRRPPGRDRRGRRGRNERPDNRNRPQPAPQRHNEPKKKKEEEHDWTLDLM
jgi:hypothetical protein